MSHNKLVFLIEDDPDIRDALSQILGLEGFAVQAAENGQEGLNQLRSMPTTPDMILLDIMMPVMDGYQFLEERQRDPGIRKIPVLILTANQSSDNTRLVDIQGFLRKPLDLEKLISTMQTVLC
jgi:two-component system chemotaxis response regulator CheY